MCQSFFPRLQNIYKSFYYKYMLIWTWPLVIVTSLHSAHLPTLLAVLKPIRDRHTVNTRERIPLRSMYTIYLSTNSRALGSHDQSMCLCPARPGQAKTHKSGPVYGSNQSTVTTVSSMFTVAVRPLTAAE